MFTDKMIKAISELYSAMCYHHAPNVAIFIGAHELLVNDGKEFSQKLCTRGLFRGVLRLAFKSGLL